MLLDHLFENGFILMNTCSGALSTVMTQKHVDMLAETLLEGFRKIRDVLRDNGK
jgi:glutamate-1-semialdehyde 2,1-aminomutase